LNWTEVGPKVPHLWGYAADRILRIVALGRKNYVFAGFNAGGERAA
jgi:hypothetical protein